MIKQAVAKRYAKGLFGVGEKDERYKEYLGELEAVASLLEREPRLGKALMLPLLEMARRKELLVEVSKSLSLSPSLSNMLMMLLEKNRISYLPMVRDVYGDLVDEKEGRVRGTVWTAYPMDDATKKRIENALKEKFSKEVVLQAVEDKNLIGGVKVNIRGTIIDGSVKRQLETLKENILKE